MSFRKDQLVRFKSDASLNAGYFRGPLKGLQIRHKSHCTDDYGRQWYEVWEADKRTSWNVMEEELTLDTQYIYTKVTQCQKLNETTT